MERNGQFCQQGRNQKNTRMVSWTSSEEMFHKGKRKTKPNTAVRLLRECLRVACGLAIWMSQVAWTRAVSGEHWD